MTYLESREIKKARKDHYCDYCWSNSIKKGDSYLRATFVDGGHYCHSRQCEVCTAFAKEYPEDAQDAQDAYDGEYCFREIEHYEEFAAEYSINKMLTE